MVELKHRLRTEGDLPGYTLGRHCTKFIVVNDGGDHGNIAFRQAITVLSKDDCTAGTVMLTARIKAHENYDLFNSTINPILSAGVTRLQETAFLVLYTRVGNQIIPVPFTAATGSENPINPQKPLFENTRSHSDFVVTGTDPDDDTKVVPGTLTLNEEAGLLLNFSWQCERNGVTFFDSIDVEDTIRKCDVTRINCLPTAVIGVGDIPYQGFMLGKCNMGGFHCNYCTCPKKLFGKEETATFQILTQEDLVETGTKIQQHKANLANGLSVGAFKGIQGISNPPYSRIPVQMWMEPHLHMGLGTICDTVNRTQEFIMLRIYNHAQQEYMALVAKKKVTERLQEIKDQIQVYDTARDFHYKKVQLLLIQRKRVIHLKNEMNILR